MTKNHEVVGVATEAMPALPGYAKYTYVVGSNELWNNYLQKLADKYDGISLKDSVLSVDTPLADLSSSKDRAVIDILGKMSAVNKCTPEGDVSPLDKPMALYGMNCLPFETSDYVMATRWVSGPHQPGLSHHLNNATRTIPWTPVIGDALKKDILSKQKYLLGLCETLDPVLNWFEHSEETTDRGTYFPIVMLARLSLYDSRLYGRKRLSTSLLMDERFETLRSFDEVIVMRPQANVGFEELEPLSGKGRALRDSRLYKEKVEESVRLMPVLGSKLLPLPALQSLIAPHAVGKRHQSSGRAIIMVTKVLFFIMSLWGQPLTRFLEKHLWYASGDRAHRLGIAKALLDGKIRYIVDGDDFVIMLPDGTIIYGDYSAFESSLRKQDHLHYLSWLERAVINRTPWSNLDTVMKNVYYATSAMAFVSGVGIHERNIWQGVDSGKPDTHTEESYINACSLEEAKGSKNLKALVSKLSSLGREMRESAQHEAENNESVVLAKLWSDGKVIHGSIIRALWSLVATEGTWAVPPDQTLEEWLDGRVIAILSNVAAHPLFDELIKIVKSTGYQLKSDIKRVTELALDHMSKRRMLPESISDDDSTGVIERASIRVAIRALQ